MAETKTATYKRYNGKDWDTIYFATSASQVGESSSRFFIKPSLNTVNGKQFTENGGITLYSTDIKLSSSDTTTVKDAIAQAMSAIPTGVLTTANYATTLDSVYEKKSDATSAHNTLANKIDNLTTAVNNRYTKTESDNKYQPKGTYATLGTDGKVPSSQLPSYVDDVIEGYYSNGKFYSDSAKTKEITGEGGKIYTDLASNKTYRWGGTAWVEISASLAIGETTGTAYDGKKGHDTNLIASQALEKANAHDNTLIELTNGKADKATTLAGYGITDAYTKTEADGKYVPYTGATKDVNLGNHSLLISDKTDYSGTMIKVSGKGDREDDAWTTIEPNLIRMQGSAIGYRAYLYPDQLKIENNSAYSGVGVDGLKTAIHEGGIDKSYSWYKDDGIDHNGKKLTFPEKDGAIALLSDIPDAYTKTESDTKYQPKGNYASSTHTHTFASLTSKPTTLSGYGITDAYTKTESDGKYVTIDTNQTIYGLKYISSHLYIGDHHGQLGFDGHNDMVEYLTWVEDGSNSNHKLYFPEGFTTMDSTFNHPVDGVLPITYEKTLATTDDISNRATKIYFEDTVPTSGMVAGDICIEY